ncbi:MAG: acylphosphatase [Pseudomonadota bacterium]
MGETKTVRAQISGRVQGVGYRAWTHGMAGRLGLSGWVRNEADGTVTAVFSGPAESVDTMLAACRDGPALARVDNIALDTPEEAPIGPFGQTRPGC